MTAVGVVGPPTVDLIAGEDGQTVERRGGTAVFARRALEWAGATAVAVEVGPPIVSRLDHRGGQTRQAIDGLAQALTVEAADRDVLPSLADCEWVVLGGQTGGEFPPAVLARLADAGHRLLLDAQGLARGERTGPVVLGPFPPDAYTGVRCLKLNAAEARAALGGDDEAAALRAGTPELLLTHGAAGLLVATAGSVECVPASGTPFANPTGAGDSLSALYCLARTRGADPVEAARTAVDGVEALYGSS